MCILGIRDLEVCLFCCLPQSCVHLKVDLPDLEDLFCKPCQILISLIVQYLYRKFQSLKYEQREMLTKPESCNVLHNTCTTVHLRTTDASTPTKCAEWRALFGLLPSGSRLPDLKCLYSRQECVNEIQQF